MSGENWDPVVASGPRPLPRRLARRRSRPGSRRRSPRASGRTLRSSGGSSRTRCRSTAARRRATRSPPGRGSSSRRSARPARRSRSRSATAPGESRSPAPTTATRCASSPRSSTSSARTSTRCRTTRSRQVLTAAFACELVGELRQAGRARGVRRQLGLRLRRPRGRLLPAGSPHDAARGRARAGSRGTTATTTTCAARIRTATTCSSSTSGSPTATGQPEAAARASLAEFARARRRRSATRAGSPSRATRRSSCPSTSSGCCPFTTPAYRQDIRDNLFQSYVAAREADLPVAARPRARRDPGDRAALPRAVREAPHRARPRPAARARDGRRDGLPLLLRRQHDEPARAVAHVARRDLRRPAHPPLRARRPDRGRRGRARARRGTSATSRRAPSCAFRVGGEPSARAFLPVEPAGAEVVAVDGRRPSRAAPARRSAPGAQCSAPTRSSTWPRGRRGVNPESTWRLYSALATIAGVARPVRVDDPRVLVGRVRSGGRRRPRSSSTARATRSTSSRSSRTAPTRRAIQPCRSRSTRSVSPWLRVRPRPLARVSRRRPSSTSSAMHSRRSPHTKGVMRSGPDEWRQRTVDHNLRAVSTSELTSRRNDVPTRRKGRRS